MSVTKEFQERVGRIDGLVRKLESSRDPTLRDTARDLIQSLMELHGTGLESILEIGARYWVDLIETALPHYKTYTAALSAV